MTGHLIATVLLGVACGSLVELLRLLFDRRRRRALSVVVDVLALFALWVALMYVIGSICRG